MKTLICFACFLSSAGCDLLIPDDTDPDTDTDADVCELARDYEICPECYSGEVQCIYGEFTATVGSCGECQARGALYAELCEAGVEDDGARIERETTCEVVGGIDTGP
jgi:hypothetical protein